MSGALIIVIVIIFLFLTYYAFDNPAATVPTTNETTSAASALTQALLDDNSPCTSSLDCQGNHCVFGHCTSEVPGSISCTTAHDCPNQSNQYCDNGVCINALATKTCNPGCAPGYACQSGVCTSVVNNTTCSPDCKSPDVCSNLGCTTGYTNCTSNSDCLGPDSICTSDGYCSCAWGQAAYMNFGCFLGTPINLAAGLPSGSKYTGPYDVLNGYISDGTLVHCNGKVCSGYQQCVNGVCT